MYNLNSRQQDVCYLNGTVKVNFIWGPTAKVLGLNVKTAIIAVQYYVLNDSVRGGCVNPKSMQYLKTLLALNSLIKGKYWFCKRRAVGSCADNP